MDSVNNQKPARASWLALYALLATLTAGCAVTPGAPLSALEPAPAPAETPVAAAAAEPVPAASETPAPADLWDRIRAGMTLQDSGDPRVAAQLRWYAANQEYLDRVVTRAQPYLHYIVEEVEKRGMPMEVALLPIVESAFDPFAYSHGRAAGLWQFIAGTGKRYQLDQQWWYDGRRDVQESTRAALDYLSDLHLEFNGDWLLALASYNVGEGRVAREVRKNLAKGKPIDFWHLSLPRETSAYVPKLLALKRLLADPESHGVRWTPMPDEPYLVRVEVPGQIDLAAAAELADIPVRELYLLNPGFNRGTTPPDGPHVLLLPRAAEAQFRANLAARPPAAPTVARVGRHTVQKGDTLLAIAGRYGSSVEQVKALNNLVGTLIHPGQALMVPGGTEPMSRLAPDLRSKLGELGPDLAATARLTYQSLPGDTLWRVAREHGVTAAQLARWNGLDTLSYAEFQPGTELVVWDTATVDGEGLAVPVVFESVSTTRLINYVVRRGDNLWKIARSFGTSAQTLAKLNRIPLSKPLRRGQRIKIQVDVTQQSGRS